ncbi:uncharacterized protein LOC116618681 [Nematostella vectensis]|uniref:uncharacterized protein LOC116618681 n=1 Tax=Nematostella vectensis TaxID=45351 RepID=UPI00138FEC38|nr:uncharacterized protein LOC116618681 [Nematostella vectensis]
MRIGSSFQCCYTFIVITSFIAEQESRQEFHPLLGRYVDNIHVDSLHLKNNACALAHRHFLDELMKQCFQDVHSVSSFSKLPPTSKFVRYVETLRSKCCLPKLAKKVVRWFEEGKAVKDRFDYRFTGRDSRMFLFNFMYLFEVLEEGIKGKNYQQRIHGLALVCRYLRDSVSLFTRVQITDDQVSDLEGLCSNYVRANYVFYYLNPTVWPIGFVVPVHTKDMVRKYGMGLGLNSMEGREAKHVAISKYARNTMYHKRWEQIFRHEFASLIWLRDQGFELSNHPNHQISCIPKRTSKPDFCNCAFLKEENKAQCTFCSHPMMEGHGEYF